MSDLITRAREVAARLAGPGETVSEHHPAYLLAALADECERLQKAMARFRRLSADGPWGKNDLVSKMATIRSICAALAMAETGDRP